MVDKTQGFEEFTQHLCQMFRNRVKKVGFSYCVDARGDKKRVEDKNVAYGHE